MGHITSKNFQNLQKRLDASAQGAPETKTLYKILEILFTENEAQLASQLPINFFTIEQASKIFNKSKNETHKILNNLSEKGILLDLQKDQTQAYILAPTMAGFFEFSLMRLDNKFDKKILSELFYQYINQEDKFTKRIFSQKTQIDRVFPLEQTIPDKSEILNYEKATHIIESASCITVGTCYCRHKMQHLGKACDKPQNVCLTFNHAAQSLAKHKIAKK